MNHAAVRAAEEELLTSPARRDPDRLRELLHPDFVEIGRSGRKWTRDEIVVALSMEPDRVLPVTSDWEVVELAPEVTLVTYVIRGIDRTSRHSSVWTAVDSELRLRLHQGTFVTAQ